MKRKRKPAPRTRRTSFEQSLDIATSMLEKALARKTVIQQELETLDKQIPYLQQVIRALTPQGTSAVSWGQAVRNGPVGPKVIVPASIKEFVEPIRANGEIPSEEDQFLQVTVPGEKELLP